MKKERNRHGHLSLNNSYFCGSLFLLLLLATACKSNQIMIDSNEVESIHFWFVGDIDTSNAITDCIDVVLMDDHHKIIISDRKIIERFVDIINRSKPINPNSNYDLRVSSLVRL
ncbi:hypothetical protein [Bacteroides sp. GM023]|uniref:hypothetical protein n=1 Tax=Bacteroides sp. GM023 TaxID=2723058 RepID=UPI001CC2B2C4|nr:hypothetical protein [Bacteroides sp. GM023]